MVLARSPAAARRPGAPRRARPPAALQRPGRSRAARATSSELGSRARAVRSFVEGLSRAAAHRIDPGQARSGRWRRRDRVAAPPATRPGPGRPRPRAVGRSVAEPTRLGQVGVGTREARVRGDRGLEQRDGTLDVVRAIGPVEQRQRLRVRGPRLRARGRTDVDPLANLVGDAEAERAGDAVGDAGLQVEEAREGAVEGAAPGDDVRGRLHQAEAHAHLVLRALQRAVEQVGGVELAGDAGHVALAVRVARRREPRQDLHLRQLRERRHDDLGDSRRRRVVAGLARSGS